MHPVADLVTGTHQFRAQFGNPDRLLVPGQLVRVRLQGLTRNDAALVPERALLRQMGRQTVYVVGQGDSVAAREVVARAWVEGRWLVECGLASGDRVIVDGTENVAPRAAGGDLGKDGGGRAAMRIMRSPESTSAGDGESSRLLADFVNMAGKWTAWAPDGCTVPVSTLTAISFLNDIQDFPRPET